MRLLAIEEGDFVGLTAVTLPAATFVRLRPVASTASLLECSDHKSLCVPLAATWRRARACTRTYSLPLATIRVALGTQPRIGIAIVPDAHQGLTILAHAQRARVWRDGGRSETRRCMLDRRHWCVTAAECRSQSLVSLMHSLMHSLTH